MSVGPVSKCSSANIMNMPTSWSFRSRHMLLWLAVHCLCGAYTPGAETPMSAADFLYSSMRAAQPRHRSTSCCTSCFFLPGIAGAGLCRLFLRRRLLAHRRAFQCHRRRPAGFYHFNSVMFRWPCGPDQCLQGVCRNRALASVCLRTGGNGRSRLTDCSPRPTWIEEQLAHSEYVEEESRKIAIRGRAEDRRNGAPARHGGELNHERPRTRAC